MINKKEHISHLAFFSAGHSKDVVGDFEKWDDDDDGVIRLEDVSSNITHEYNFLHILMYSFVSLLVCCALITVPSREES